MLIKENMGPHGAIYGKWMTSPNTWTINFGNVYCYLLIGKERALLFDTAYGSGNLRAFVEDITDKPLYVVNSHGHFDHSGGNPWWPEVYAGPSAELTIKDTFSPDMQEEFEKKPHPDYKVNTVREGHIFDLGDREVEVIEIPAHHESSIALLDRQSRSLFMGDEMEAGQVLLFVRRENIPYKEVVAAHKANMEKLMKFDSEFETIFPAHNGPQLYKQYLYDYIELSKRILEGTAEIMPNTGGFGFPAETDKDGPFGGAGTLKRAQFGGASFVYAE